MSTCSLQMSAGGNVSHSLSLTPTFGIPHSAQSGSLEVRSFKGPSTFSALPSLMNASDSYGGCVGSAGGSRRGARGGCARSAMHGVRAADGRAVGSGRTPAGREWGGGAESYESAADGGRLRVVGSWCLCGDQGRTIAAELGAGGRPRPPVGLGYVLLGIGARQPAVGCCVLTLLVRGIHAQRPESDTGTGSMAFTKRRGGTTPRGRVSQGWWRGARRGAGGVGRWHFVCRG